jgi:hypothetical protein
MSSMPAEESADECIVRTGVHAPYRWLTATDEVYMGTLLRLCPEAVLNRYLAVTSYDSGVRRLSETERSSGWSLRGDVAYSPLVTSVDSLQFQRDGLDGPGYDEWYVFQGPRDLGRVFQGNPFEFQPGCGQILVFVNTPAFVLHDPAPYMPDILDIFWNQLALLQPETFIADGRDFLTLVSKNEALVQHAHERLAALPPQRG